ncbi:MAG TPA: hypothetical protein VND19_09675 [Acetobacteraceae bacterium]|nr:hypothetical protein [Acetobacteraceae bacterium]
MSDRSAGEDDPPVALYRVVDEIELSYLQAHGDYGSNLSQFAEYFALTIDGARAFANAPMNARTVITTTTVPQSVVKRGARFNDPGVNGAGLSVFFSRGQLVDAYDTTSPPTIWKGR